MRGTSHFVRSISITIGSSCAGRDRTDVENISIYSLQRFLSCSWSSGEPSNVIMAMISGVSGFALLGRTSNGSGFHSMLSSSAMASSNLLLSMRVDSSIGVMSANALAWGRQCRSCGTRGRAKSLVRPLHCQQAKSLVISLHHKWGAMVSLASPIGSGRV